jgi:hypothetical protein
MDFSRWNRQQTTIGHLKVRYTGSQEGTDKTVLRLRIERLLSNADVQLPGVSTGALLIVRKLESPARLPVATPSHVTQTDWHELLRSQLTALQAAAARPGRGAVPLDARSVFFADPAEMLTCVTQDLLNGQAGERWYWQQLLPGVQRTPGALIPALWCELAAFVPTVLSSLKPAEVHSLIAQLEPYAVTQILRSLHESFDLPRETYAVLSLSGREEGSRESAEPSTPVVSGIEGVGREPADSSRPTNPPWQQWLPGASSKALSPEGHYLFGLGLALYHAPALARSTRFADQTLHWLRAERAKRIHHSQPSAEKGLAAASGEQKGALPAQEGSDLQSVPFFSDAAGRKRAQFNDSDGNDAHARWVELPLSEERLTPIDEGNSDRSPMALAPGSSSPLRRLDENFTEMTSRLEPSPQADKESQGSPVSQLLTDRDTFPTRPAPASSSQTSQQPLYLTSKSPALNNAAGAPEAPAFVSGLMNSLPAHGVSTRLGGVLYLINLLIWLGLPHTWDDSGTMAAHLSGWAIVEALARGLLGDLHEHYIGDPVWHALALLDGRDPGLPVAAGGLSMGAEKSFRLPAVWLKRYGSPMWSAFQHEARLLLCDDAAAFLIADVPLRDRTFFEAAHAEVEAYCELGLEVNWHPGSLEALQKFSSADIASGGVLHATPAGIEGEISSYLDEHTLWWLGRVLGFVRYLLARSLGEPPGGPARLAQLVLCRQGQLIVSRTHVDLHMSMEEISIEVRRAGLDRDPGWVPDLARVVYFHFD